MVGSIQEILKLKTAEDLQSAFPQLEKDLDEKLIHLEMALDKNVFSGDHRDIWDHMTYVEGWRNSVCRYLYLVTGFVEYAKSSRFSLAPKNGITETMREQWKKTLAGPFVAMQFRLQALIDSIDSRVNLCKKKIGMEVDGHNLKSSRFFGGQQT